MNADRFCVECGAEILTDEDLGAADQIAHERANLVGVPAVGKSVRYETVYYCSGCVGCMEEVEK